jgi:hypothetical protein
MNYTAALLRFEMDDGPTARARTTASCGFVMERRVRTRFLRAEAARFDSPSGWPAC